MPSRRDVIIGAATLPILMSSAARGQDACAILTEDQQRSTAPDAAIARLQAGNERFVAGRTVNCDMLAQVKASAPHQTPFAAVLGCIDSRVPPELVFDQRIGAIFSARVAGNFVNTDMLGSLVRLQAGRRQGHRRPRPFRVRRDQGRGRQGQARQSHGHAPQLRRCRRSDPGCGRAVLEEQEAGPSRRRKQRSADREGDPRAQPRAPRDGREEGDRGRRRNARHRHRPDHVFRLTTGARVGLTTTVGQGARRHLAAPSSSTSRPPLATACATRNDGSNNCSSNHPRARCPEPLRDRSHQRRRSKDRDGTGSPRKGRRA